VLTVLALSQLAGAAAVGVWALVAREQFLGAGATAAGVAAGVCGAVGLGALYRGMAIGAMGVVAPISSVAAAIPFAYGVASGERPSVVQFAGVVVALAGLVFVSRAPGDTRVVSAGVGLALLAALGFGFYFIFLGEAADESVPWAVLVARLTSTTLALGAVLAVGATLRTGRALLAPVLAVGICDTSANVLFALASTRGLLSVVSVLTSLYPALTVALAALLLRERVGRSQLAGGAAVLAGAALLTAG
jgi:drug/metabolite transporter (DMT)-like permease